ncbi:MAG: helix-turn-helix transcriptional regulator, partial [Methyloligellaceae bacterium]
MHGKRQQILEILKGRSSATVEELRQELGITSVTVRHHLDVLRAEGLVGEPAIRRRSTPGRPQYDYSLTPKAEDQFPRSYARLAHILMDEIKSRYDASELHTIFERMSDRLVNDIPLPDAGVPLVKRLAYVVESLNDKGYLARWEQCDEGLMLYTCNCPYESLAGNHPELCHMDMELISRLVGVETERVCHLAAGDQA